MVQVLLFHAWSIGSPIGIDSFIMVSAFLMTSSFVRRSEAGRMPFFGERWANTFKRLLPPLVVVILATLAATFAFLPMTRWRETIVQAFASLTYWENWRLVHVAADYYADDHALASPFQHLWSMSMQGQVFILWPLIMTGCVLVSRRMSLKIRSVVLVAFAVLAGVSLLWLILAGPVDGSIYFDTRARIWQFAFGSAIAAAAPWLKLPPAWARAASSLGLIVLITFCLVSIGSYPGPMAIIPMLSVSAILLYAHVDPSRGVGHALSRRPLPAIGDISYAVYLIHWPIFVFYLAAVERERLGFAEGIVLIAASLALAWVLTALVDKLIQSWAWANASTQRKYAVAGLSLLIGLLPVGAAWAYMKAIGNAQAAAEEVFEVEGGIPLRGPGSDNHPGARALFDDSLQLPFTLGPIPGEATTTNGWAAFGESCRPWVTQNVPIGTNGSCSSWGDPDEAEVTVLVAGNSHAQQLILPMIEPMVSGRGWSGDAIFRGCLFTDPAELEGDCMEIAQSIFEYTENVLVPDYVFVTVTRTREDDGGEALVPGIETLIRRLTDQDITVIGVRDNPRSDVNLFECSRERDPEKLFDGCILEQDTILSSRDLVAGLHDIPGFHYVDMTDALCIDGECPTIIGNMFVYMDTNHLNAVYATTMAPYFVERFDDAIGGVVKAEADTAIDS